MANERLENPYATTLPDQHKQGAVFSYLVSIGSYSATLPLPFFAFLSAGLFYLLGRKQSRFAAMNAWQNLLSQMFNSLFNAGLLTWTWISIANGRFSKAYFVFLAVDLLLNLSYLVSWLQAILRAGHGEFYPYNVFGRMAWLKYYGPNAKPFEPFEPHPEIPEPAAFRFSIRDGALFLFVGLVAGGLAWILPGKGVSADLGSLTLDAERKLGQAIEQSVRADRSRVTDPVVVEAVEAMKKRLSASVTNSPFPIRVYVIKREEPNAFTLPGGVILIHAGLLSRADRPEEVAAVLAHEMGHVVARDSMQALARQLGASLLLAVATGGQAELARDLVVDAMRIRYGKEQEAAADAFAARTLAASKLSPGHLAKFFEKMLALETPVEKLVGFMDTHPDTEARLAKAREAAKSFDGAREVPLPIDWARVKSRLPGLFE